MKRWYRDSIGLRLTRAARLHRARAQALLAEIGLHPGQETVLQALMAEDGQPMNRLAEELRVRPPTVTKMVARMAEQDLVRRIASAEDGRSARIYLTDTGRERALALKALWKRLEAETLGTLGKKERRRLARLLGDVESALAGGLAASPAGEAEEVAEET